MTQATAQLLIIDEAQEISPDARNEHQLELEKLFDKNQLLPRIREAFKSTQQINFAAMMKSSGISEKFGFDLLAQMAVHKRADVPTILGCLRSHCDTAQEVALLLERCVQAQLVKFETRETDFGPRHELIVVYEISDRLQRELDMFQYPLPMVVPPRTLTKNRDSGYLTGHGSLILRDNHHEQDICLDHLNRMNRVKLTVNLDTAQMIKNKWRNLDKKNPDETWEDFQKRKRAFEKYDRVAKNVLGILVQAGNEIYLTHKYDKRGRTYCQGFHVTYQGTDWNKAVIELAEKETLNE